MDRVQSDARGLPAELRARGPIVFLDPPVSQREAHQVVRFGLDDQGLVVLEPRAAEQRSVGTERVERILDRWGVVAIFVATPLLGVWTMALAAKGLGMASRPFLIASSVSVAAYAVVITASIMLGLDLIGA